MASTSQKPKKGILKHSGSIDHRPGSKSKSMIKLSCSCLDTQHHDHEGKKEIEWDEMNILATYHPPDKDYGFMKVDEPPTPYNRAAVSDNEEESGAERKGSISSLQGLDPAVLAQRLEEDKGETSKEKHFYGVEDDDDDESEHENETEEERKKRKAFLLKRKMHYNEFQAVQLAKKLMAEEDEDDDNAAATGSTAVTQEKAKNKLKPRFCEYAFCDCPCAPGEAILSKVLKYSANKRQQT